MGFPRFRPAVTLLPYLLYLVKGGKVNDGWMRIVEHSSVFFRGFPLLFVPNGIGVGLEVDRAAGVLLPFQNMDYRVGTPVVRIGGLRAWALDPVCPLIRGGI